VWVGLGQLPDRLAEQVLRHHPGAAAGRDEDLLGNSLAGELRGYVNRAVADPADQDPFPRQVQGRLRIDVVVGVDRLAVEGPGEFREARIPVVPVADDQEVELLG
jgi:hypothetical protein